VWLCDCHIESSMFLLCFLLVVVLGCCLHHNPATLLGACICRPLCCALHTEDGVAWPCNNRGCYTATGTLVWLWYGHTAPMLLACVLEALPQRLLTARCVLMFSLLVLLVLVAVAAAMWAVGVTPTTCLFPITLQCVSCGWQSHVPHMEGFVAVTWPCNGINSSLVHLH
jgi:hypothetical protein